MTSSSQAQNQVLIQGCMQSLRRIVKALEQYSRSVEKRFDLTGPQLWALWELGQSGPIALKDLAMRMHLESSTVVGVVDRLVAKSLMVRLPDPQDRRRISLELTPRGREILAAAPHPAQGHLLAGLASLSPARIQVLQESLNTLEGALQTEHLDAPFFFSEA